ncbi:MAG: hypothetical protein EZS28_004349 [Streblomastix strix]|uniref:Uncharacterized protein n=1 Tax=Streblomastix strix TaxID=222440 RepID=A0A5J4WYE9_9EUKA|nr:MAG: hypothetical protein EZS28_004349 [Streblomastix strix]
MTDLNPLFQRCWSQGYKCVVGSLDHGSIVKIISQASTFFKEKKIAPRVSILRSNLSHEYFISRNYTFTQTKHIIHFSNNSFASAVALGLPSICIVGQSAEEAEPIFAGCVKGVLRIDIFHSHKQTVQFLLPSELQLAHVCDLVIFCSDDLLIRSQYRNQAIQTSQQAKLSIIPLDLGGNEGCCLHVAEQIVSELSGNSIEFGMKRQGIKYGRNNGYNNESRKYKKNSSFLSNSDENGLFSLNGKGSGVITAVLQKPPQMNPSDPIYVQPVHLQNCAHFIY